MRIQRKWENEKLSSMVCFVSVNSTIVNGNQKYFISHLFVREEITNRLYTIETTVELNVHANVVEPKSKHKKPTKTKRKGWKQKKGRSCRDSDLGCARTQMPLRWNNKRQIKNSRSLRQSVDIWFAWKTIDFSFVCWSFLCPLLQISNILSLLLSMNNAKFHFTFHSVHFRCFWHEEKYYGFKK